MCFYNLKPKYPPIATADLSAIIISSEQSFLDYFPLSSLILSPFIPSTLHSCRSFPRIFDLLPVVLSFNSSTSRLSLSLIVSIYAIDIMKSFTLATAATSLISTALAAPSLQARDDVTPITVKGNAFFKGDERFYIRGLDYQPGGSSNLADPITDVDGCKRDIPKFKELGVNTIRVYSVDNSKDHDECMNALADAGIYLVLDVNTPKYSINRSKPKESYNDVYLQYIFATVEKFAKYKNTLAFFSGNEVINDGPSSSAAPYVKAVTRDLRQYIRSRGLRKIPVGYSAVSSSHGH